MVTIVDDVPTASWTVVSPLAFSIPTAVVIEVLGRRNIIPFIQVPILVIITPRSQRLVWAMGLVFRFPRRRDTLLRFFIDQILPPNGVPSESIPQFSETLDITNIVGDDLVGDWALIGDFVGTAMFSLEQSLPFLFHQLPVCPIDTI